MSCNVGKFFFFSTATVPCQLFVFSHYYNRHSLIESNSFRVTTFLKATIKLKQLDNSACAVEK